MEFERKQRQYAEVGQKLWQAGVLMSQSKFEEAEAVMKDALPIPQSGPIYDVLGITHARMGKLDIAITDFISAATIQHTNDMGFRGLLPVLIHTGRISDYEEWRRKALAEFRTTEDAGIAERMAFDCLLLPGADDVATLAIQMLDKHLTSPPRPFAELARGLAEYRKGQFAEAAERLEKSVDIQTSADATLEARLVLGMAHAKLGKPDKIALPDDKQLHLTDSDWDDQMSIEALSLEARKIIPQ